MSQPSKKRRNRNRDASGRFVKGNHHGVASRFRPGQCGNPRGRPRKVGTWIKELQTASCDIDVLERIISEPTAQPTKREAARQLLIPMLMADPPIPTDPERAYRYYRGLYKTGHRRLEEILIDRSESPDRRAAAYRRMRNFW